MKNNANIIGSSLAEASVGLSQSLRNLFAETNKTAREQLGEATKDAENQIFSFERNLKEGDEVALTQEKSENEEIKTISNEHMAYFREVITAPQRKENEDRQALRAQIEEIRIEIKKLKDASKEMEIVFREVSSQETPEKPGKYHLNFYEWIFVTIRNAREKMDEVNTLGAMVSNRSMEKRYMAMAKKHGTSFTMNNERSIARPSA